MHRIEHSTRVEDKHGPGKHGYTGGDPDAGIPPTRLQAGPLDAFQEEIANVIEKGGFPLKTQDTDTFDQLHVTIRSMMGAFALDEWTEVTIDTISLRDVAYNKNDDDPLWVAIGGAGSIAYSRNLRDWSTVANPASGILYSVTRGAGNFAAVGLDSGMVYFSSAGAGTWSSVDTGSGATHNGIHYANGLFVVVGNSGLIQTSPDLSAWTEQTSDTVRNLNAVTYSSELGLWVAVGNLGTIVTSPDGVTWTSRTSGTSEDLNHVAAGRGRIVAGGDASVLLRSDDGSSWTAENVNIPSDVDNDRVGVCHDGVTQWLVATDNGAARSVDGDSWVVIPAATARGTYQRAAHAGGFGFLLGSNGFALVSRRHF